MANRKKESRKFIELFENELQQEESSLLTYIPPSDVIMAKWEEPEEDGKYPAETLNLAEHFSGRDCFVCRSKKEDGSYAITGSYSNPPDLQTLSIAATELSFLIAKPDDVCWKKLTTFGCLPVGKIVAGYTETSGNFYVGKHRDYGIGMVKQIEARWVFTNEAINRTVRWFEVLCTSDY